MVSGHSPVSFIHLLHDTITKPSGQQSQADNKAKRRTKPRAEQCNADKQKTTGAKPNFNSTQNQARAELKPPVGSPD